MQQSNYLDYTFQNSNEYWYCIECCSTIFPFSFLSNNKTSKLVVLVLIVNIMRSKDLNHNNGSLSLKPSPNLELLVNQFNNATPKNSNDPEKTSSSKYYQIDEMHNIEIPHKNKSLSLVHINSCSLNKNLDNLQHPLGCTKNVFDIIVISETRITKKVSITLYCPTVGGSNKMHQGGDYQNFLKWGGYF